MKSLKIFYFCVMLMFLSACNGSEEKTTTDTSTDTTAMATPDPAAPASSIVTTPQNMVVAMYKVADFNKWRPTYDARDSMRQANGIHNYVIARGIKDSNMLLLALKIDDVAKAKAFVKDPALKQSMQKGGVLGTPTFDFTTMVYQDTSVNNMPMRSRTTFMVKDWATWQKSFEEGRQERMDNGLVDRAYGHDVEDNKKVVLVVAIMDSTKAAAYWTSDMLKKRRAAGGVIGQPERFIYRVVQRY